MIDDARLLPRFRQHQAAAPLMGRKARHLIATGEPDDKPIIVLSLIGDELQARGIPLIARGVQGAIAHTTPGSSWTTSTWRATL